MRYQPLLNPAPAQLIDSNGQAPTAIFDNAVGNINFSDFAFRTAMDQPASAIARYFAFKQFQFVGISGPDWWFGLAIANIRYVSTGFVYFARIGQKAIEINALRPFSLHCDMAASASNGLSRIGNARTFWQIDSNPTHWNVDIQTPQIKANLHIAKQHQLPLALCAPTGYQGATYTEKNNALPVQGQLSVCDNPIDLTLARAGYDFSAGFMRRQTAWRWASINTTLDGEPFGLNLACGVNETGVCENVLWYQQQRQHLSPARFQCDQLQSLPWQINTLCGEVDLQFSGGFCRRERLNLGILASNFRQYTGYFNGTIQLADGRTLQLKNCPGWIEDHYAKW